MFVGVMFYMSLFPSTNVNPIRALTQVIECQKPGKIDSHLLPMNLRIIQAPSYDDVGYSLVNPQTRNIIAIPGTNYPGFIEFVNNNGRLLFLRAAASQQVEWVTMNIDGSDDHIIRTSSQWPVSQIIGNDNLHFFEENQQEIFNLQDETFTLVPDYNLVDFVPLDPISYPDIPRRIEFNADATHIAYRAYQRKPDGSLAYGEVPLIRIQNLLDGTFTDIQPASWKTAIVSFDWSNTTDQITAEIGGLGEYVEIYNATTGKLLNRIDPPETGHELTSSSLSWSPDKKHFVIQWNIHYDIVVPIAERPHESILAIYELSDTPQLEECLILPRTAYAVNENGLGTYHWSSDGRLIWWMACPDADFICPQEYDLMLKDIDNGQYGALAKKVNIYTAVSFLRFSN
jgi:hypothetical protein